MAAVYNDWRIRESGLNMSKIRHSSTYSGSIYQVESLEIVKRNLWIHIMVNLWLIYGYYGFQKKIDTFQTY